MTDPVCDVCGLAGGTLLPPFVDGEYLEDPERWRRHEPWHGTPNGYVNRECRCDPCRWAWASYRRGDTPVFAGPVWFDDWLTTGASHVLAEVCRAA